MLFTSALYNKKKHLQTVKLIYYSEGQSLKLPKEKSLTQLV